MKCLCLQIIFDHLFTARNDMLSDFFRKFFKYQLPTDLLTKLAGVQLRQPLRNPLPRALWQLTSFSSSIFPPLLIAFLSRTENFRIFCTKQKSGELLLFVFAKMAFREGSKFLESSH